MFLSFKPLMNCLFNHLSISLYLQSAALHTGCPSILLHFHFHIYWIYSVVMTRLFYYVEVWIYYLAFQTGPQCYCMFPTLLVLEALWIVGLAFLVSSWLLVLSLLHCMFGIYYFSVVWSSWGLHICLFSSSHISVVSKMIHLICVLRL